MKDPKVSGLRTGFNLKRGADLQPLVNHVDQLQVAAGSDLKLIQMVLVLTRLVFVTFVGFKLEDFDLYF